MPLYAAIDLHSTNSVLAVLDETGKLLRQCRMPNDLPTILGALDPFRNDLVGVAVESTYNWYWLVDGLADHGYPMKLVNTTAVPQYDGLKYSGDETDARHLAQLMRLGILPEGYIYPRPERAVRDLLRQRFAFVRQSVGVMQSVQSAWARHTGQCLSANAFRQLSGSEIKQAFSDPCVRLAVHAGADSDLARSGPTGSAGGKGRVGQAPVPRPTPGADFHARHRPHPGADHHLGERRHPPLRRGA